jgi:hypothetical protein
MPQLALLADKRPIVVVVGTSVRKPAAVLRHYLASLAWQELPPNVVLVPVFVADNADPEADALLREWTTARDGKVLRGVPAPVADFSDEHPETHQWSATAMERVGVNKDRIIARARELRADYVWFCDADLICDTTTLASMLAVGAPIVTAVYWTYWSAQGTETRKVHAAPQVWLRHPYELSGFGWTEHDFRARLAQRQLTQVPGYGACTLLSQRALDAGVAFARVPNVPVTGLMAGEDRHFCLRAQALHLDAWADPWPDIYHIYHLPTDLRHAPAYVARLSATHPERASLGDLVSATIQPIEPVPWANGGWTAVPPQRVRGRLGQLALVPELEEAFYGLKRGATVTVPVHFPAHYAVPYYQGKRRLLRITLHDAKPNGWAPVLENEMLVGARSGNALRTTDYNARQLDGMREITEATNA